MVKGNVPLPGYQMEMEKVSLCTDWIERTRNVFATKDKVRSVLSATFIGNNNNNNGESTIAAELRPEFLPSGAADCAPVQMRLQQEKRVDLDFVHFLSFIGKGFTFSLPF